VSPDVAVGQYVKDTVTFGQYTNKDTSVLLEQGPATLTNGVLGFAYGGANSFMSQLKANSLISKEVFAFYFSATHNFATLGNYE
jgi:hypothetical protein